MASIINASTSGGLIQTADTSGVLQLQSGGTTIMTISSTGVSTQVGAPAFSAYSSANQSTPSSNVLTKVLFDTEEFDTNNNFASSRFTPTVAGYYLLTGSVSFSATVNNFGIRFYKNGTDYSLGAEGSVAMYGTTISNIIYLNGSTDYVEIYASVNTGTFYGHSPGGGYSRYTWFSGSLIRSA